MKAEQISIIEFFQQPKQLTVFNPQRTYRWKESECRKLWDDTIRAAQDTSVSSHFLGTIIYAEYGMPKGSCVPKCILIDGQQRLVTLSLLIAALKNISKCPLDKKYAEINDMFLFNSQERGQLHYKLMLAQKEMDTFVRLTGGEELTSNPSQLIANYRFFAGQINDSGVSHALLYEGITKLTVMGVSTDQRYENPHLVYEKINSTGLDAEQTGLIRNWLSLLRKASMA